jgi:hypothetical protein
MKESKNEMKFWELIPKAFRVIANVFDERVKNRTIL